MSAAFCVAWRAKPPPRPSREIGGGLKGLGEAVPVGLLLWRAQFQMFLNQTLRSRKVGRILMALLGAGVVVLAWVWEAVVSLVVVRAANRFGAHLDLVPVLSLAFFTYTAVLIFSSLIFSLNSLLLNPDLDMLLVSPRSVESILGGRMVVQVLRLMLLGLLFTGPALVIAAIVQHNPLIPFAFALIYLLYPIYVVVLISLLSLLLVRIIPQGRGREILTILGVFLALGVNLLNFLLNPALRGPAGVPRSGLRPSLPDIPIASAPWMPSGWAGRSAAAVLTGNWISASEWMGLLLLASAAIFIVGALLSGRLYLAGWIQAVPPRRRAARPVSPRHEGRRLPLLGPVEAAIVLKDFRMRTRDLAQLIRFVMPLVFLVIIFVLRFPRMVASAQDLGRGPVAAMLGLVPAWILLFSLAISLGLSAVSLEGKSIWIYAASPNSTLNLLQAKCWSTGLPIALMVGLVAIAGELIIRPGWPWALVATISGISLAAAITALMVGLGAAFARFDWTDARRMTNPAGIFLGMALFSVISLATVVLFGISLALASVSGFPVITTWIAGMLVAVGASVAVAALALLIGNQRLQSLELG
jgi:hypothetical protein